MEELARLDGIWRFHVGTAESESTGPDYDDSDWETMPVPAHWHDARHPYYSGEAWYRTRFITPATLPDQRCFLRFEAVDYEAQAWLNGRCLGRHEGYFGPFQFDISDTVVPNGENTLAVRVTNPPDGYRENNSYRARHLIKGALALWDCNDPRANPGGIWQSVRVLAAGPTEIESVRVTATHLGPETPLVHLALRVRHAGALIGARLEIALTPRNFAGRTFAFEKRVGLAPGDAELSFDFELPGGHWWWPWDWGHPDLYTLTLRLRPAESAETLASFVQPCGLREVSRGDRWALYLNGQHIFVRGTSYLSDQFMSRVDLPRYRSDLELVRQANLNAVRPFGNIERPEFYSLCDELGILVLQFMPIQYGYNADADFLARAMLALEEMVALLDPHPCVVMWLMNAEPDPETYFQLDRPLARRCRELDPSRPVLTSGSPIVSHHLLDQDGAVDDWLAKFCHYTGVTCRTTGTTGSHAFVAEFGQAALPGIAMLEELGVRQLWPPDWETLSAHNAHEDELRQVESEAGPADSMEQLVHDTQRYQGEATRYFIDHYRCHRFDYCNLLVQFLFSDCWPAASWSVLDYGRRPKASYAYLQEAFAPVVLAPDCPPVFCLPGDSLTVPLYVINDTPVAYSEMVARATVYSPSLGKLQEIGVTASIAPNCANLVGVLEWQAPVTSPAEEEVLELWMSLAEGQELCHRTYRILVRRGYLVPLADRSTQNGNWAWFGDTKGLHYQSENGVHFARFLDAGDRTTRLLNRAVLHSIPPGERLAFSVRVRATSQATQPCQLVIGFDAVEPMDADPFGPPGITSQIGARSRFVFQTDGTWQRVLGLVGVPIYPEEQELHLVVRCDGPPGVAVDITEVYLRRPWPRLR